MCFLPVLKAVHDSYLQAEQLSSQKTWSANFASSNVETFFSSNGSAQLSNGSIGYICGGCFLKGSFILYEARIRCRGVICLLSFDL